MKLGKWIAGGLGWAFFGPIGGLLGFALGAIVDSDTVQNSSYRQQTTQGDFGVSLVVLVAAIMKADGKVLKSELDFVKAFFQRNFGQQASVDALKLLRDLLKQKIPVDDVARQIGHNMDYSSKLQLLHFLYGIAAADGVISSPEETLIRHIGLLMGIKESDVLSTRAMFGSNIESAYQVLEISSDATDDEVKKAYRKLALKHHPDKVEYLGSEIKKAAEIKFRKLNEAYELIKKERGIV